MKTCTRCDTTKPISDFYKRKDSKDGHHWQCKQCIRDQVNARYAQTAVRKGHARRDDWRETERRCTACDTWKPWEEFGPRKTGRNGRSPRCLSCTSASAAQTRQKNRELYREQSRLWYNRTGQHYLRNYGITREQRDAMAEAQGGLCAGCSREPGKRLVVDHCQRCNTVRKLLCDRCNMAMHVLDDPELLARLLAYRDEHLADGCNPES